MERIQLPRVAVSRELASSLVRSRNKDASNDQVELDARSLVVNNESFVSQLAQELQNARLSHVKIRGGSPEWQQSIELAVKQLGLELVTD